MSPKSRGRKPSRKPAQRRGNPRPAVPATQAAEVLRDARVLLGGIDVLEAELWASAWLGQVWTDDYPMDDLKEESGHLTTCEVILALEVIGRACDHPSPHGRAAVAALGRLAAAPQEVLAAALARLSSQVPPGWETDQGWQPVSASQAVSVWGDLRVLMVEFTGPVPHVLVATLLEVGGTVVTELAISPPRARQQFEQHLPVLGQEPMTLQEVRPEQVLADLADALRRVDQRWPRPEESSVVDLRAVAWQRAAAYLPELRSRATLGAEEEAALLDAFLAGVWPGHEPDPDPYLDPAIDRGVARSLAQIFLDFGQHCLPHPLAWSPLGVDLLLAAVLPADQCLDQPQRDALESVLGGWIVFALHQRGLASSPTEQAVAAVTLSLPAFLANIDDPTQWSLVKRLRVRLEEQGIDLTDPEAVGRQLLSALGAPEDD